MLARTLNRVVRFPLWIARKICCQIPYFRFVDETAATQTPATFEAWVWQNIFGVNRGPYWPVDPSSRVVGWKRILAGVETSPGFSPGCYIQAIGTIKIGDYTQIAPNVGIISANHDLADNRKHEPSTVEIGRYCWIGMGAIILPGVTLGDFTVVGAGAVVTSSFEQGKCVVAGNPAKMIKQIPKEDCVEYRSKYEYHGYIPKAKFEQFRREMLSI